jgi:ParB family chromosome partitioning protein
MASFKEGMEAHVSASMTDRPDSGASRFTVKPSGLQRLTEGRKRLDSGAVIRLDRIIPDPLQPRKEFDPEQLDLLSASLKARGQLQPIRVRWDEAADRYIVVVGERRYRASLMAGLETISCVVASGDPTAEDLLEDQLVENALRVDLRPVEQARAYRTLMEAKGLTQRELAERLHISPATVARQVLLLDLPTEIQQRVDAGSIAANTAYELTKIQDPAEQAELGRQAAAGQLTRDELKVRTARPASAGKGGKSPRKPIVRTFRTATGKVTVELRKGLDAAQVIETLRAALGLAGGDAQEAA